MSEVLVVGAGPVGLTLAAELARHGTPCRIVERLPRPLPYCRALGVTPRTLEVWEDMGVARAMIDAGLRFTGLRLCLPDRPVLDLSAEPTGLPYDGLSLPQPETERLLAEHLAGLGIGVERGLEVTGLLQDDGGVTVEMDGKRERFAYVVGCDGAHSLVRRAAGIAFEGDSYPYAFMLGDVHMAWDLPRGVALRALRPVPDAPPEMFIAIPLPEPGRYRVSMLAPPELELPGGSGHGIQAERPAPGIHLLQAAADRLLADPPQLSDLRWSSIFRISMRLAERYRRGRLFLAGDAAHIHPPTGGQGMNTGIQDAYNLAWKLALVLQGKAPQALLDSYEAERRAVGAEVVARTTAASENLGREKGGKPDRLADTQVLVNYRGSAWVAESGSAPAEGLPRAGDRAPDAGGLRRPGIGFPLRLFELLRGTEHVLLASAAPEELEALTAAAALPPPVPIRSIALLPAEAPAAEPWGLATLQDAEGRFAAAYGTGAWLVRPDGYIAWRGPHWSDPGLAASLARYLAR